MIHPSNSAAACFQGFLNLAMEPLNKPIRLRMVDRHLHMLNAQCLAQATPHGAAELRASVCSHNPRNSKPGYPGGQESIRHLLSSSAWQQNHLWPLGSAVNHSQHMREASLCDRQRSNQVNMHMAESVTRHWEGLHHSRLTPPALLLTPSWQS